MDKLTIKEWAADDRPREKLFRHGEQKLSDAELLAVLLRTGVRGQSALDLARKILQDFGSLRNMGACDRLNWKPVKGLGPVKIAQIKAAFELGKRFLEEGIQQDRPHILCAKDAADLLAGRMRDLKVEVFKVIYLNNQSQVICIEDAAQGTVNQVTPIIREILHRALIHYASAMICVHNHPSGSLLPSPQDRAFTRSLKDACGLMGIKLMDHIIISSKGHCSVI